MSPFCTSFPSANSSYLGGRQFVLWKTAWGLSSPSPPASVFLIDFTALEYLLFNLEEGACGPLPVRQAMILQTPAVPKKVQGAIKLFFLSILVLIFVQFDV